MRKIRIGWAGASITPDRPVLMVGQMYHRVSEYVRDPLTATALALDNGETQAVFVSLDMVEPPYWLKERLDQLLAGVEGLDPRYVSLGVTHTHSSSDFNSDFLRDANEKILGTDILPPVEMGPEVLRGEEAQAFLAERLSDVIRRAWEGRTEGGVSSAQEYAVTGFNRRPVFRGEGPLQTVMYGDCSRPEFTGFENGADSGVGLLYTWDAEGKLTGVVVNVSTPSQVFELHRFLSADFWAFAREDIRASLGNVHVLALCGAAGDVSPVDLVQVSRDNREALKIWGGQTGEVYRNFDMTRLCAGIGRRIGDAVRRGLQEARGFVDYAPAFSHRVLSLRLPLRQVTREEYEEAAAEIARLRAAHSPGKRMTMAEVVRAFEPQGVVLRYREQQERQTVDVKSHVVRLGTAALATNPFELFHAYGLRMKARTPARPLMVVQLSNGLGGYLPTQAAIEGGSYSSKAASTQCGPEGGDLLVEETVRAVNGMF